MNGLQVQLSADPKQTSQVVLAGLRAFNRQHLGEFESEPIAVELVGDGGEILGGAAGSLMLGWLFVDMLWLPEDVRGSGMGTKVMDELESQAIQRGATRAILDTAGFQAEEFYLKRGYVECGRVTNFASGFDRIYLTKVLVGDVN